jgi:hypothetical protein
MARQAGPQFLTGTIGGVTFYKLLGRYYARKKSSLDRERIKRDKAFERFRRCASVFGRASALASVLYWSLPLEQRGHGVQGRLTGEFYQLLLSEVGVDRAVEVMVERYLGEKEGSRAEPQGTQRKGCTPSRQGAKGRQEEGKARKVGVGTVVGRKGVKSRPKVFRVLKRCRHKGRKKENRQAGVQLIKPAEGGRSGQGLSLPQVYG